MARLNPAFKFFDTIDEANNFKRDYDKRYRHRKPASVSPWSSMDGKEHKFLCWYQY